MGKGAGEKRGFFSAKTSGLYGKSLASGEKSTEPNNIVVRAGVITKTSLVILEESVLTRVSQNRFLRNDKTRSQVSLQFFGIADLHIY